MFFILNHFWRSCVGGAPDGHTFGGRGQRGQPWEKNGEGNVGPKLAKLLKFDLA